jgi:hypothetical protein
MQQQEGGANNVRHCHWYKDNHNNNGWDLPPPQVAGVKVMDTAMPTSPLTNNGMTTTTRAADDVTRGEGRTTMTSNESGWWMDNARRRVENNDVMTRWQWTVVE